MVCSLPTKGHSLFSSRLHSSHEKWSKQGNVSSWTPLRRPIRTCEGCPWGNRSFHVEKRFRSRVPGLRVTTDEVKRCSGNSALKWFHPAGTRVKWKWFPANVPRLLNSRRKSECTKMASVGGKKFFRKFRSPIDYSNMSSHFFVPESFKAGAFEGEAVLYCALQCSKSDLKQLLGNETSQYKVKSAERNL
jgi:hypothetical protein